jgi:hypothetical protein
VLNFQSAGQTVEVDLSGVTTTGLAELRTGSVSPRAIPFRVELPAYGYQLYQVKPSINLP